MLKDAVISDDGLYRYRLTREWSEAAPIAFIGVNPSTADASEDDPTIRKCIGFAERLGAGGIVMLNLFAWRSTDVYQLPKAADPVGPENDTYLVSSIVGARVRNIVCAWGTNGGYNDRDEYVTNLIRPLGLLRCFQDLTKAGFPRHPLYVAYQTPLIAFFGRGNITG